MNQRITIKDVAADAGVSISVVSYILNGAEKPVISEATRKRVMDSVRKLGYVPNRVAATLRKKESKTIGIISFWDYYYVYGEFLKGITREANNYGYLTFIHQTEAKADEMDYIRFYLDHMVDGLILILPSIRNKRNPVEYMQSLIKYNVPFSAIGDPVEGMNNHIINIDYASFVKAACQHFAEKGYRRITYITLNTNSPDIRERLVGYHEAAKQFGFEEDICYMNEIAERIHTFEAVVVYKSDGAYEVLRIAKAKNIEIPKAFEIIAANTEIYSQYMLPSLSTVHLPGEEMGMAAMDMLFDYIHNKTYEKKPIGNCTMMLRETTRQNQN